MPRRLPLAPPAITAAAMIAGCGGGGQHRAADVPAPPARPLVAATFRTVVPSGWHVHVVRRGETVVYYAASPGARVDRLGLPHPSGAGLTVLTAPARGRALEGGPLVLTRRAVGIPPRAKDIRLETPAHRTRLDGAPAGALTFVYRLDGRPVRQQDVVSRRDGRLALLELDTIAAPGPAGTRAVATASAAFGATVARWRWRERATGAGGATAGASA